MERYLLWGAIVVLFIMALWPRREMYTGEPNSITKMEEFKDLNDGIKHLYNDNILRGIKAWVPTFNKWWKDLSPEGKAELKGMIKQAADMQVANAAKGATTNGVDLYQKYMGPSTPAPAPSASTGMVNTTQALINTSGYTVEPFMPMMSGFSLQGALAKAADATKMA